MRKKRVKSIPIIIKKRKKTAHEMEFKMNAQKRQENGKETVSRNMRQNSLTKFFSFIYAIDR